MTGLATDTATLRLAAEGLEDQGENDDADDQRYPGRQAVAGRYGTD